MNSDRWQQVKEIFQTALTKDVAGRAEFLAVACDGDGELRREVDSLLASSEKDGSFIDSPAYQAQAAQLSDGLEMQPGETVAHYEIVRTLGKGGMGEVYLAFDQKLRRQVALKLLPSIQAGDAQARKRLLREAQSAATLDHPNICTIYEVGEDDGATYIAMQHIDGVTLDARMRQHQLSLSDSMTLAAGVADALVDAHAHRLVHRDIKPSNIMIDSRGQAKVLDFGLAKTTDTAAAAGTSTMLSAPGMIMGTVPYMSPEQVRGEAVDSRTDIFSFGVLLYEMLFGEAPFARGSNAETISAILMQEPPALLSSDARVPRGLKQIITRCLRKNKDDRYQSMVEVAGDLKAVNLAHEAATEVPTISRPTASPPTANVASETRTTAHSAEVLTAPARPRAVRAALLVGLSLTIVSVAAYFGWIRLRPAAPGSVIDSIAVLPLANNTGDSSKEYLSDGISESLIGSLAQLPNVKVMARNSAFQFKGKVSTAQEIAAKLKVRGIVSGDMRQQGDNLIINIEFIDAADGHVVFNHTYAQKASELVSTQTNIVRDVIAKMFVKLSPEEQQRIAKQPTSNNDAYQLFLKGNSAAATESAEGLHQALKYYQQAVEIDPNFALAYALMAQNYITLGAYFEAPNDTMPQARRFAEKAIQLDYSQSDAHAMLGVVYLLYDWDYDAAQRELTLSGKFNPEALTTFSCAAHLLESTGRMKEAGQEVRDALARDPLSQVLFDELGCTSYYARDFDGAIVQSRQGVTRDPLDPVALWNLTRALDQKHAYQESIDEIKKFQTLNAEPLPLISSELAYAYARSGKPDEAKAIVRNLTQMSKRRFVEPYLIACIYMGLGDKEQTTAWLTKSYEIKSSFLVSAQAEPKFDPIRSDPRFQNLLNRIGFRG